MNRFLVFIIICLCIAIGSWFPGYVAGMSSSCHDGDCSLYVGTSLPSITLALFLLLFTIFYRQKNDHKDAFVKFSAFHKVLSFILDLIVTTIIIAPFVGLPLLISESTHTGTFQWVVQRDFSRTTDPLYILIVFISLVVAMYYYFRKHKLLKKPTIGQYVLSNIK